jgi:hypothetical protein
MLDRRLRATPAETNLYKCPEFEHGVLCSGESDRGGYVRSSYSLLPCSVGTRIVGPQNQCPCEAIKVQRTIGLNYIGPFERHFQLLTTAQPFDRNDLG